MAKQQALRGSALPRLLAAQDIFCKFKSSVTRMQSKNSTSSPLCNPRVEIPAPRQTFPGFLVWPIYSARLCTLIKSADTHDPKSTSKPALSICSRRRGRGRTEAQCSGEKVHSDTQMMCLSLGCVPHSSGDVISLSHFSFPLREFTSGCKKKGTSKVPTAAEREASQHRLAAGGMMATVRLQSVI